MSEPTTCCGGPTQKKDVLLYACSGGANVAEASDAACRQLMRQGLGSMFCLAGLAAGIEGMVQQARDADLNVVIDGCPMDCARRIFDRLGLTHVRYVRVTDLGLAKKPRGVAATADEVQAIVDHVKRLLATP